MCDPNSERIKIKIFHEDLQQEKNLSYLKSDFHIVNQSLLCTDLLEKLGIRIEDYLIFYLCQKLKKYILCNCIKGFLCYLCDDIISLKIRKKQSLNLFENIMEDQFQKEIDSGELKKREIKGRRAHERKIGIIIEKVALWRKLYTGLNLNGMTIQLNLEVAAQKVDLSKKTLDDYLYQIRLGKKNGFDFNSNMNEKIGKLRKFNRLMRKINLKKEMLI